ncbi:ABC transporter [Microbacterium sp. ZW T5_56]|uniref:ABC transporter n=1 Tax=Microbacterium sp. ZW T5_56 TaxID=3378081 RepID=UPI0038543DB2
MTRRLVQLPRRAVLASTVLMLAMMITACSAGTTSAEPSGTPGSGHGAIVGAVEAAEPPLQLLTVDADGAAGVLDLLDGTTARIDGVARPEALATDGRYVFISTVGGVQIVDSGVWSWDHGDHFHYYRAPARVIGLIPGAGPATVTTGPLSTAGSTAIVFSGGAEAVVLDNAALARGEIVERFRVDAAAPVVVAPLGDGAAIARGGRLDIVGAAGETVTTGTGCRTPSGSISTRAGVVIGCAEGAMVIASADAPPELVPFPGGAPALTDFDGRKGRPTVAAIAPDVGFWLLDARARSWELVPSPTALVRVVAVDDTDDHVVALDADGRVRVFRDSAEAAVTEPLTADPAGSSLVVDGQRAYLNDAATGVVHEIDYADNARIARALETPTAPTFFAEVGR